MYFKLLNFINTNVNNNCVNAHYISFRLEWKHVDCTSVNHLECAFSFSRLAHLDTLSEKCVHIYIAYICSMRNTIRSLAFNIAHQQILYIHKSAVICIYVVSWAALMMTRLIIASVSKHRFFSCVFCCWTRDSWADPLRNTTDATDVWPIPISFRLKMTICVYCTTHYNMHFNLEIAHADR